MALDVSAPEPPSLSGRPLGGAYNNVTPPDAGSADYRRDELASLLADGVWADGFEEWAMSTGMSEGEFTLLRRHGVVEQLDFYWDPAIEGVGSRVPALADDARAALAAGSDPDEIASELDSLARAVAERLEVKMRAREE